MAAIKFIYFDLDDTLLDHRHAERRALGDLYDAYPAFAHISLAQVQAIYHEHNVEVWRRYSSGELTTSQAQRLRFERLVDACGITGLQPDALGREYFEHYGRHWTLCDGADVAFHALADRFPVGVLTNGFSEIQHAKLAQFSALRDRLSALVISEEVGYMKPHPRLFEHATEAAGVAPGEILYIGDSYRSDVQGSLTAGWRVAWYTQDERPLDDDRVVRFSRWRALDVHAI